MLAVGPMWAGFNRYFRVIEEGVHGLIGSTVDKYEVLQKVGEGGMATVYRGRHTTLDRDVAIKVLHPHLSSSTRNRKRFAREARAIEHLRHENILEIFDYSGIESGDCYIITEFVEGQTLSDLVDAAGRLPSELVAMIGIKLGEALGYAHESGILHRDLKPDNVMVREDGTIKLMDFGIARFLDESQVTLTGALVGSPAFMSPEQALEAPLDTRSDLFSLGTVLFYLVTGEFPFTGSNPSLILKKVIEGERPNVAELAPEICPGLADTIEHLMATSPDGRFHTAKEVTDALAAVLQEVEIRIEDPTWEIRAYLEDSTGYSTRLSRHVGSVVLQKGKQLLDEGRSLEALRQFNRLLALDEDNQEVLDLVSNLHIEPERASRPVAFGLWLALVVLLFGSAAMWFLRPGPADPPPPVPSSEPAPLSEVPQPEPAPAPMLGPVLPDPAPTPPVPRVIPKPPPVVEARELPGVEVLEEVVPSGPARLQIVSNMAADIYQNGRRLGSTRTPLDLQPGAYVLEIRSDVVKPFELRVELGPGEQAERRVNLEARPADVRLDRSFAGDCSVALDGMVLGTVAELGWKLSVPRPNQHGHALELSCADKPIFRHMWSTVVLPGQEVGP